MDTCSFCPHLSLFSFFFFFWKSWFSQSCITVKHRCFSTAAGSAASPSKGRRSNSTLLVYQTVLLLCRHTLCTQTLLSESITYTPQVTEQFITVQLLVNVQWQAHYRGKVSTSLPKQQEDEFDNSMIQLQISKRGVQTKKVKQNIISCMRHGVWASCEISVANEWFAN